MDEITTLLAEVLRTMASPRRLEILHRLAAGPCEVSRLADDLGLSQPNVSQHLTILRSSGLVDADRDGREVRYRLTDTDVMVACAIMRGVLERRLRRLADLTAADSATTNRNAPISALATTPVAAASATTAGRDDPRAGRHQPHRPNHHLTHEVA